MNDVTWYPKRFLSAVLNIEAGRRGCAVTGQIVTLIDNKASQAAFDGIEPSARRGRIASESKLEATWPQFNTKQFR